MSVYLCISGFLFSAYLIANLWAMRSNRLNQPCYVLTDMDGLVGVRHNSLSRLFAGFATLVPKQHIRRIQVSSDCLMLFTHADDCVNIWLSDRYLPINAHYAKMLFPQAEFIETPFLP
ncbi:hypothetical protein [Salinimonas chungwhensis]|uniref:hypothetical protein n=1 Tax=Salinimonas chungwhensis TaxID=265425 RepID=UPI000370CBC0|nr:hypothetical protein [Salinimonas chungwhensis]